jgi:glycosyltransferase involved in cell wall biosynthesis
VSNAKPTVAICIPTYNRAEFIGEALRSVMNQDYRPIEVWISDDGSTDDTDAVVKEFIGGPVPVHLYRQPVNCGIAKNNNWVLSQPGAEYIVRLDSDDVLEQGYVSKLLELLQAHPQAGYAHCAVHEIDRSGRSCRVRRLFRSETFEGAEGALRKACRGYRVAANLCMFRARTLREVGYYRGMDFAEDWDLSVRIADAGWGNVYCDAPLGRYRTWSDESNSRARRKKQELIGIEKVFRESLKKAFERRGWPVAPLHGAMRDFALAHSDCLAWDCFSDEEKRELQSILCRLGESRIVTMKCWMALHGFSPMFRIQRSMTILAKDRVKAVFSFLREG